MLSVAVLDDGKGIKKEERHKLFTKFGKLERTAAYNLEGSGMGLMISKRLVMANGGGISIDSAGANQGCIVLFKMRMSDSSEGPLSPSKFDEPAEVSIDNFIKSTSVPHEQSFSGHALSCKGDSAPRNGRQAAQALQEESKTGHQSLLGSSSKSAGALSADKARKRVMKAPKPLRYKVQKGAALPIVDEERS